MFSDNIRRVLGFHGLSARALTGLIDVSAQTLSDWQRGKRQPSLSLVLALGEFFELPGDKLVSAPFSELLPYFADRERFERVEHKIRAHRTTLRAIDSGKPVDAVTGRVTKSRSADKARKS